MAEIALSGVMQGLFLNRRLICGQLACLARLNRFTVLRGLVCSSWLFVSRSIFLVSAGHKYTLFTTCMLTIWRMVRLVPYCIACAAATIYASKKSSVICNYISSSSCLKHRCISPQHVTSCSDLRAASGFCVCCVCIVVFLSKGYRVCDDDMH